MKKIIYLSVFVLTCMYHNTASAQLSRKEMIFYYKLTFLDACMEPFEIDTGFREEVCGLYFDGLDKKSYIEIDSMSALSVEKINSYVKMINESSDGNSYPTRFCILKYCLDQYESKDMDKMAGGFARRMKKVKPVDYHNY